MYDIPGRADRLDGELVVAWNTEIQRNYDALERFHSRFFSLDPTTLRDTVTAPITWFGDAAEPNFCLGQDVARQLFDWGPRGRHGVQNEYCEYAITYRADSTGVQRPKRVTITTELREYWVMLAVQAPEVLRQRVKDVLGVEPPWAELYGAGVSDPTRLDPFQREVAFSRQVAGNGNKRELEQAGVPNDPTGALNNDNVLFMTHPINGLDDLLYIVMFGAKPYAREGTSPPLPASARRDLSCRRRGPSGVPARRPGSRDGGGRGGLQR